MAVPLTSDLPGTSTEAGGDIQVRAARVAASVGGGDPIPSADVHGETVAAGKRPFGARTSDDRPVAVWCRFAEHGRALGLARRSVAWLETGRGRSQTRRWIPGRWIRS